MTAILILGVILFVICLIFKPAFDVVPLDYSREEWLIIWFNKYSFHHWKVSKIRNWAPLFRIRHD